MLILTNVPAYQYRRHCIRIAISWIELILSNRGRAIRSALPNLKKIFQLPQFPYLCLGKKNSRRERDSFPSLFPMSIETQLQTIEGMAAAILEQDPKLFLVEARVKPTNNIKLFVDGDSGITIEQCIAINRALYKQIEEAELFPSGDFSLEVSSPGLDEPLKMLRQYHKNVGRKVEVLLKDGIKLEGLMKEVGDEGIIIQETKGKNKKQEIIDHNVSFESIKSTKIQIVF